VSKVSEDAKPRPRARMVLRAEIVLEHGDVQTVAGHVLRLLSRGGLPGVSADDIHAIEVHPPARLILVSGEPDAVRKAAAFVESLDAPAEGQATQAATTPNPWGDFDEELTAQELVARQGVEPLRSITDLRADWWPEDETADDIIAAVREWRTDRGRRSIE